MQIANAGSNISIINCDVIPTGQYTTLLHIYKMNNLASRIIVEKHYLNGIIFFIYNINLLIWQLDLSQYEGQ